MVLAFCRQLLLNKLQSPKEVRWNMYVKRIELKLLDKKEVLASNTGNLVWRCNVFGAHYIFVARHQVVGGNKICHHELAADKYVMLL